MKNRMNTLKKVLAMALTAAMVTGMSPVMSYAEESGITGEKEILADIQDAQAEAIDEGLEEGSGKEANTAYPEEAELSGKGQPADPGIGTVIEEIEEDSFPEDSNCEAEHSREVAMVRTEKNDSLHDEWFEDFDKAVKAWNSYGAGATLFLMDDIEFDFNALIGSNYGAIKVSGGTEKNPMILVLGNYGLLYTGDMYRSVIHVCEGSHLYIRDTTETGPKRRYLLAEDHRGKEIDWNDYSSDEKIYLPVTGGFITGGRRSCIYNEGSVTMESGTIVANVGTEDTDYGGGVYNKGTFRMDGGTITENYAPSGGGVYNHADAAMIMNAGEIKTNTAHGVNEGNGGGGVFVSENALLRMNGGFISDNRSESKGGGIFLEDGGSLEMSGGLVFRNTAASDESGIAVFCENPQNMEFLDEILAGAASDGSDAEVITSPSEEYDDFIQNISTKTGYLKVGPSAAELIQGEEEPVAFETIEDAWDAFNEAGSGSTLRLLRDTVTYSSLETKSGSRENPMILDLNDHGILMRGEKDSVLNISKGGLELTDTSESHSERYIAISKNKGYAVSDDIPTDDASEAVVVKGGYITGGASGGVSIWNNCYFKMSGGTICANTGFSFGGVNVGYHACFEMTGGTIENNTGSGVCISDSSDPDIPAPEDPQLVMSGGTIRNNHAYNGGGINSSSRIPILIEGGTITGNTADNYGGGICGGCEYFSPDDCPVSMSGGSIIGNHAGISGGGIYCGHIVLEGGELRGNTASVYGYAVSVEDFDNSEIRFDKDVFAGARRDGKDARKITKITTSDELDSYSYLRVGPVPENSPAAAIMGTDGSVCEYEYSAEAFDAFRTSGPGTVLKLLKDVTTEVTIEVNGGSEEAPKVIDLNGHGIRYGKITAPASVIHIGQNAHLRIKDSNVNPSDKYLRLYQGRCIGVYEENYLDQYTKVTGGYIAGGWPEEDGIGGGIINDGALILSAGIFCGNSGTAIRNNGSLSFRGTMKAGAETDGNDAEAIEEADVDHALASAKYLSVQPALEDGYNLAAVSEKGAVASVYESLDDALFDWYTFGPGAVLTLLDDLRTVKVLKVKNGSKKDPMVLDLNDHGILYTPAGGDTDTRTFSPVIEVMADAFFELRDSAEEKTERYLIKNGARAVDVSLTEPAEGTDYASVTGGYISGGYKKGTYISSYQGGGILNHGTVIMYGGTIAGNTGVDTGGVMNFGTFTMKGGAISENWASTSHVNADYVDVGGGVTNYGQFVLDGGTISGNYSAKGAGVYNCRDAEFRMCRGKIVRNWSTYYGAGLYNLGTTVMTGGLISENSDGGVVCDAGTFRMQGGEISGNINQYAEIPETTIEISPANATVSFDGEIYVGAEGDGSDAAKISAEDLVSELETNGVLHYGYLRVEGTGGDEPGPEPEPLAFTHDPVDPVVYTGKAVKPVVKVYYGENLLTEGKDYTIRYNDNVDAGEASFTISGKGNYGGSDYDTFDILQKSIDGLTIPKIASISYNKKKNYTPVPVITYNGKKLKKNTDFRISYYLNETDRSNQENAVTPKDPGHYYVRIDGIGNFKSRAEDEFDIASAEETPVGKLSVKKIADQPYEGAQIKPIPVIKNGSRLLEENTDYELFYGSNKEIGTGYITITGKGAYVGSRIVTFRIVGKPMKKVSVTGMKNFTYDGNEKTQDPGELTIRYKASKKAPYETLNAIAEEDYYSLNDTERSAYDCVISYKNNLKEGKATMILKGVNGYSGTLSKTFKIQPYDVENDPGDLLDVSLDHTGEYAYCKSSVKPVPNVRFKAGEDWITLTPGKDYSVSYLNNRSLNDNTGRKHPTVKITGKGNFKGSDKSLTFAIGKADLGDVNNGIIVKANGVIWKDKAGNYKTGVTVVDAAGKKLKAGTDFNKTLKYYLGDEELTGTEKIQSGTDIRVIVTGKGKYYTGTAETTFRIAKNDISKLKASGPVKTYTGSPMTIREDEIIWKNKKNKVQEGITCRIVPGTYQKNINTGTASVTVEGTGECCGQKTVTFKIRGLGILWSDLVTGFLGSF